ncbi:MAG: hypothetical protein SVW02_01715 [Candidatus Nanohaloarchaea archaeon]|nr:hypothetical protein [Candidatus Nanohaloarchaea archaeon]
MRRYYVVTLALLILLAGCTSLTGGEKDEERVEVTPGDGLTIQFQPVKSTFKENEVLQFLVSVANTGERDAKAVKTSLFGSPLLTKQRCQALTPTVFEETIEAGAPRTSIDNWRCDAPLSPQGSSVLDLPAGATDRFEAGLEVLYDYTTEATTKVTVAIPSEASGSSAVSTQNTAAPVHATIDLQSPRSAPGDSTLDVPITVQNVGDGTVEGPVEVWVYKGDAPAFDASNRDEKVRLVDGSRQIVSTLSGITLTPKGASTKADKRRFTIHVHMEYTYKERITNPFTVQGQPPNIDVEKRGN